MAEIIAVKDNFESSKKKNKKTKDEKYGLSLDYF